MSFLASIFVSLGVKLSSIFPAIYFSQFLKKTQNQSRLFNQAKNENKKRRVFVDISVLYASDSGTGIQRVVRSIAASLRTSELDSEVFFIVGTKNNVYRCVDHEGSLSASPVILSSGDCFLGLDFAPDVIRHRFFQFISWKLSGAKIIFFVYDLLPSLHPAYFNSAAVTKFERWLWCLAIVCDKYICVSEVVAVDLRNVLLNRFRSDRPDWEVVPLAGDFQSVESFSKPSKEFSSTVDSISALGAWVLVVGTIEPRKGHTLIIDAFEHMWAKDIRVPLVFVGRSGWKTKELQSRLNKHPELGGLFHWFDKVKDPDLRYCYEKAFGVIVASQAEGFGLPVAEALEFNKPLLLRDIPVFKEVAGDDAIYFSTDSPEELAEDILNWLASDKTYVSKERRTWTDTVNAVARAIN